MKKLQNFLSQYEVLDSKTCSLIFGGHNWRTSGQSSIDEHGCSVEETDMWDDYDNDGVRDRNEPGVWIENIDCTPCDQV